MGHGILILVRFLCMCTDRQADGTRRNVTSRDETGRYETRLDGAGQDETRRDGTGRGGGWRDMRRQARQRNFYLPAIKPTEGSIQTVPCTNPYWWRDGHITWNQRPRSCFLGEIFDVLTWEFCVKYGFAILHSERQENTRICLSRMMMTTTTMMIMMLKIMVMTIILQNLTYRTPQN